MKRLNQAFVSGPVKAWNHFKMAEKNDNFSILIFGCEQMIANVQNLWRKTNYNLIITKWNL